MNSLISHWGIDQLINIQVAVDKHGTIYACSDGNLYTVEYVAAMRYKEGMQLGRPLYYTPVTNATMPATLDKLWDMMESYQPIDPAEKKKKAEPKVNREDAKARVLARMGQSAGAVSESDEADDQPAEVPTPEVQETPKKTGSGRKKNK